MIMKIEESVELLIEYAKCHLHLDEEDATYKRNLLLKYFGLDKPFEGKPDLGHKPGHEFWRYKKEAESKGSLKKNLMT